MQPLPRRRTLAECRQGRQNHLVQTARALAATHDENDGAIRIEAECNATFLQFGLDGVSPHQILVDQKLRAHWRAGSRDLARFQARTGIGKADERLVHKASKKTVGAAGNGVGFVQERFRTTIFRDENRRRTGESTHRKHGIGFALLEKFG